MQNSNVASGLISPYPGTPPFSWILSMKVCDTHQDADACVGWFGKKGSGKSTGSLALAEDCARNIAYIRGKGEDPKEFFDVRTHCVSVTKLGAISLLTSGAMKKYNSVFILDDVKRLVSLLILLCGSAQWNSRNAMSWINKALNDVLTIARIYKCIIILNCVMSDSVDKVVRQLLDYKIQMVSKNTFTKQSIFKAYICEAGADGTIYNKFLTWHRMRIKYWVGGLPTPESEKIYKEMRLNNTTEAIEESYQKLLEKTGQKDKPDGRLKDYRQSDEFVKHGDLIRQMTKENEPTEKIVRKTGLTRYKIQRIQSIFVNEGAT
jgi:hypothetical protein